MQDVRFLEVEETEQVVRIQGATGRLLVILPETVDGRDVSRLCRAIEALIETVPDLDAPIPFRVIP